MSWMDGSGNFWLFGGTTHDYTSIFTDLWEFNPSLGAYGEWAWTGGSSWVGQYGVYGTLGTTAAGNLPGSRVSASTWTDRSGNLWLFGGDGIDDSQFDYGYLNDLREFNPSTNEWAWMGGSSKMSLLNHSYFGQPGVYGSLRTPGAGNVPGGREGATSWTDSNGNLWLFGGEGVDANSNPGLLNDLWEYQPAAAATSAKATPTVTVTLSASAITLAQAQPLTVTVVVSGTPVPTGSVTLAGGNYFSPPSTLTSGGATFDVPAASLAVGSDTLTVHYTPDSASFSTYNSASGSKEVSVGKETSSTKLISSPNPSSFGGLVTFTATVTGEFGGTASGTMTFMNGSTTLGTVPVNGSVVFTFIALPQGTDSITAVYNGDSHFDGSSSNTVSQVVNAEVLQDWTWMGGSSTVGSNGGQPGVYGALGGSASGNIPGGRGGAASWSDSIGGHLWLFGGEGYDAYDAPGYLNDLWEFNPATNEWTWMSGSSKLPCSNAIGTNCLMLESSSGQSPVGRTGSSSWIDGSGNLWLFGGFTYDVYGDPQNLNDLWEFNPATNQWTAMPAANTFPSGRHDAMSWIDGSGNLWLFGGIAGNSAGAAYLNDLWEFSPSTGEWTWMDSGGQSSCENDALGLFCSMPGVYGTLEVPASTNVPSGRGGATTWIDTNGNFWLYGGQVPADPTTGSVYINGIDDLWEFNPSLGAYGEWTWMGGSGTVLNQPAVYGTLGTPDSGNTPGARFGATGWTDSSGHFWLFGGQGSDANCSSCDLNDLWEFNPSLGAYGEWAWMGGSSTAGNTSGVYGTLETPAAGNIPGGRYGATGWTDSSGNLWLFGGIGYDANGTSGSLNDMWEYQPIITPTVTVTPSATSVTTVQPLTVTITVGGALGGVTLNGSVTLSGGGYTSAATALASGSATFNISAGALATGSDTLTASYTPDSTNSPKYSAATGTATIDVTGTTPQAITFTDNLPALAPYSVGLSYTLSATGGGSGNPVTFSLVSGPATVAGATLSIFRGGTIVVAANQAGNATYAAAPQVEQSLSVDDEAQAITFGAIATQRVGTPLTLSATSTSGLTVTFASATQTICTVSGVTATFIGSGFCTIDANQAGNSAYAAAPQVPQSFTVVGETQTAFPGDWTWVGGSGDNYQGVYGILGTPAAGNFPEARYNASSWTDNAGNFWLFGGEGPYSNQTGSPYLNDLWMFNPSTSEWTWMAGSNTTGSCLDDSYTGTTSCSQPGVYGTLGTPAAGNTPGGRYAASSWTDLDGNLWLFGGFSTDSAGHSGAFNDLWKFDPAIEEWTWMGGATGFSLLGGESGTYGTLGTPGGYPGGRYGAASWTGSDGSFWLFGGYGFGAGSSEGTDEGFLNDLWKFDPATKAWTWMSGANTAGGQNAENPPGVYGTLGTPAAGNAPGERQYASSWTDIHGNLWLFGGIGFDINGGYGASSLNDLWEFNPSTNEWAWMGGSSTAGMSGVYGTLGIPAAGNIPGCRNNASSGTDSNGNFWLFGGGGFLTGLNDLWEFNPSTNEWTWISGGSTENPPGVYGTLGYPSAGNAPPGRQSASSWIDSHGTFWIFGGFVSSYDSSYAEVFNDLWEYEPLVIPTVSVIPSTSSITIAQPLTVTVAVSGTPTPTGSVTLTNGNYASAAATLSSGGATIDIPAGSLAMGSDTLTATYTPDLTSAANYGAAIGSATINVTGTTAQTITFGAIATQTVGTPLTLSATASSGLTVGFISTAKNVCTVSGTTATFIASGACTIDANQAGDSTYAAATMVPQSFSVNSETQTITFGAIATQIVGTPLTLSATASSGLTVGFISTTKNVCTVSGTAATFIASGACIIDANQAGNSAYAAAPQVQESFTVNGEVQTITFGAIAAQTVGTPLTLSATASSGLTVSFISATTSVCTVSGTTATFIASGTCTIDVNQAGNSTYAAATMVPQGFIVNNPLPVISGISPAFESAGSAAFTLTVNGTGFIDGSTVYWGTTALTTTYVNATQLTAAVTAAQIASAGTDAITVQTPAPGGGTSAALQFEVDSAGSGSTAPTLTAVTGTVSAGSTASYTVTLPSTVESASVSCLNLPAGAACSYTSGTLTITTTSATPAGTYQITVVFTETVEGAASGWILLPILLLPLIILRKRLAARGAWMTACLVLVLLTACGIAITGCGGGGGGTGPPPPPQTHQVVSSAVVTLTIQ
ncbi:MAG: kelch repeat-containing protein [Terracidiphilus sp.]